MQASGERRRVLHRRPRLCIVPIHWAGYVCMLRVYICIAQYRIGRIFRYTYIETFKHLQNNSRPEIYIYIVKFRAIERTRKLASLAIILDMKYVYKLKRFSLFER